VGALLVLGTRLVRQARLQNEEDEAQRWAQVNERAEARCRRDWSKLPEDGLELLDPEHPYASDLDLLGPSSLFQLVNTAHTRHGQRALAGLLCEPASLDESRARQQAVRCLVVELELRQRLETLTLPPPAPAEAPRSVLRPRKTEPARADVDRLLAWVEDPQRLLSRRALIWAARALPPCTLAALLASQLFDASPMIWRGTLLLQAVLVFRTHREAGELFGIVSRWQGTFTRLSEALRLLDGSRLGAALLVQLRETIQMDRGSAWLELQRLDRILGWFGLRNSEWAHPVLNVLTCWDIHTVVELEGWQRASGRRLRVWLEALGQLEALCSLAGAAHDNPELGFPELADGPPCFEAAALGHPLLGADRRVYNDVRLPAPGRALLVTGSNMSGKSTLLRAIGLASVMAFAGGPVCARQLRVTPMQVFTSLRVNDSLADGVSRFYAELARLRRLLAASRAAPVLFLIDEILAGTNSVERGIGARWVLTELLSAGALGAVSTHDTQLCQLPAGLMERVEQVHFLESLEGEALVFDFRLREGPVKAGNALRLMRSLGLSVP
jgi:hypothetical protein